MYLVKKTEDLSKQYNYKDLVTRSKKEQSTWKWIVLIGCMLFQMIPYCIALNLANVFAGSDWFLWTGNTTLLNLTFTVGALGAAVVAPSIAKWFGKEINMRVVYSIGVFLAMLGFAILAVPAGLYAHDNKTPRALLVVLLWIPTVITQVGVMIFSGLGVNNLISKWWEAEKRGVALGIAFAGGSLGNIWMQQLVGVLSKAFGNFINETNGAYGDGKTTQWATYIVLGAMGIVAGVLIAMVACRKPLPPLDIFIANDKKAQVAKKPVLEASPLVTQKYPPYWILAIGYLILQMGTVHASANGQIIQHSTVVTNAGANYVNIMATGGTIFGVTCLIGNVCGGIINDKLGPTKSIFLAGMVQCAAIFCLMLSVTDVNFTYIYFALAGLSVYIYTSTPAFICGRLYGPGQSNNQMAILGIFIALGFAIVNSISGSLLGNPDTQTSEMFGKTGIKGTPMHLEIFALVCMFVGTVIVCICSKIITNKGIKGLLEYSPTKYSRVIFFKHSMGVRWASLRILLTGKDFRANNERRAKKLKNKNEKTSCFNAYKEYIKAASQCAAVEKLSTHESNMLATVFFYTDITKQGLEKVLNYKDFEDCLKTLVNKKLLKELQLGQTLSYRLTKKAVQLFKQFEHEFHGKYPNIEKEANNIEFTMHKLDFKTRTKLLKLEHKFDVASAIIIDKDKKAKIVKKANANIAKINKTKANKLQKVARKDAWTQYKLDYAINNKLLCLEASKNKLEDAKQAKVTGIQKKIGIANYIANYNKVKQIEGHDLLISYYNDVYGSYDKLISKRVNDDLDRKIEPINTAIEKKENKERKVAIHKNELEPKNFKNKVDGINKSIKKKEAKIVAINNKREKINAQYECK